jgi:hypothetical protein
VPNPTAAGLSAPTTLSSTPPIPSSGGSTAAPTALTTETEDGEGKKPTDDELSELDREKERIESEEDLIRQMRLDLAYREAVTAAGRQKNVEQRRSISLHRSGATASSVTSSTNPEDPELRRYKDRVAELERERDTRNANPDISPPPAAAAAAKPQTMRITLSAPRPFSAEDTTVSIRQWIRTVDDYFETTELANGRKLSEADKAVYVKPLIVGKARDFLDTSTRIPWSGSSQGVASAIALGLVADWVTLKVTLLSLFQPFNVKERARDELDKLTSRKFASITTYYLEFNRILNPISDDMNESDKLHRFKRGLPLKYQQKIDEEKAETVVDAVAVAMRYETLLLQYATPQFPYSTNQGSGLSRFGNGNRFTTGSGNQMNSNRFARPTAQPRTELSALSVMANAENEEAYELQHYHRTATGDDRDREEKNMQSMAMMQTNNRSFSNSNFIPASRSGTGTGTGTGTNRYPMSKEERDRLMREGRCFACKEVGHRSSDPQCKVRNYANSRDRSRMTAGGSNFTPSSNTNVSSGQGKDGAHRRL